MSYQKNPKSMLFIIVFAFCMVPEPGWAQANAYLAQTSETSSIEALLKVIDKTPVDLPAGDPFTLQDTLVEVYQKNPEIQAARKELQVVDETYPQAMAGFRPSVTGQAAYALEGRRGNVTDTHDDPKTLSLRVTQPIYSGGSTKAGVHVSDSRIKAQRALLQATEQRVMLHGVTAYMNVLRDQQILMLTVNNETVLANHLRASRERFRLGDITVTDVKQSETRLARAISDRVSAQSNLRKSRADFESVVWILPGNLQMPKMAIPLPTSLQTALAEAEKNNPNLVFSHQAAATASATTRSFMGEKLPQVDLTGEVGRTYDPAQSADDRVSSTSLILRATFPFYSGGNTDSSIRQSRTTESQRRIEMYNTARTVREAVISAWESLAAARVETETRKAQIEAAKVARDGVKTEADYGARTTLDLLDAEQEYLNAQVSYASTERDRIVATYELLAAVGTLTPQNLQLNVAAYDPTKHFNQVKGKWYGTQVEK